MSANIAASIRARLLAIAQEHGEEFERTLTRFATERLLFRLSESKARSLCILKGASLLSVWLSEPYRATRDVDFLAFGSDDDGSIRDLLGMICTVPCPEDGLRFDLTDLRLDAIGDEEGYGGKRARFFAYLEKARIRVQIDFGFGDTVAGGPGTIEYPTILGDLPVPCVQAYSRESSVAEKFEAMVKLGTRNSRMKDFHDVWALSNAFEFDGATLQAAINTCFDRRETSLARETPSMLTSAFYQDSTLQTRWTNYRRSSGVHTLPPAQFEMIGESIIQFLSPVRDSVASNELFQARWIPRGPWE